MLITDSHVLIAPVTTLPNVINRIVSRYVLSIGPTSEWYYPYAHLESARRYERWDTISFLML